VLEQLYPGGAKLSEEEAGRRGIPDAWVFDTEGWCLIVESKVLSPVDSDQIARHIRTAKNRGFERINVLVLTIRQTRAVLPAEARLVEWREVYSWLLRQRGRSDWASRASQYLEIAEIRMVEAEQLQEGTLTKFSGVPFGPDNPFDYLEAKRIMRLALSELRARKDLQSKLGMDPQLPGRSAITGKDADRVWDFLQLAAAKTARAFTEFPHLTIGITRDNVEALATIPNSVGRAFRKNLIALGPSGFRDMAADVLRRMAPVMKLEPMSTPCIRGVQRRYPSQRSIPFVDAEIQFDIRTAFDGEGPIRHQPQWRSIAYEVFTNKKSNFQIQIGMKFDYQHCAIIRTSKAIEAIAGAWLACAPLVELARKPLLTNT